MWQQPPELAAADSAGERSDKETYSYVISKYYVALVKKGEKKISLQNSKKMIYDSLQEKMDTINHYLLREGYIYEVDDDRFLQEPHPYHLQDDTITIFENDTAFLDLGRNAFLRKIGKNLYVLNMRYALIDEGTMGWCWSILKKERHGRLQTLRCGDKMTTLPSMFYAKLSYPGGNYYFDSKWTSAEMLQLIKEGYIETSDSLIKKKRAGR